MKFIEYTEPEIRKDFSFDRRWEGSGILFYYYLRLVKYPNQERFTLIYRRRLRSSWPLEYSLLTMQPKYPISKWLFEKTIGDKWLYLNVSEEISLDSFEREFGIKLGDRTHSI